MENIVIRGARVHNLKNIDVEIPRDRLVVITGLSGSGKSTLAFDTLFAEGQRRYVESLSAYARQFLEQMERPEVESIEGLSPAIAIDQKSMTRNPRSTVGTVTEIYDYLRLLFARVGEPFCPHCGAAIASQTLQQITETLFRLPPGTSLTIFSPMVRGKKGEYRKELKILGRRSGWTKTSGTRSMFWSIVSWSRREQSEESPIRWKWPAVCQKGSFRWRGRELPPRSSVNGFRASSADSVFPRSHRGCSRLTVPRGLVPRAAGWEQNALSTLSSLFQTPPFLLTKAPFFHGK
jgi:hypothetical protein